MDFIELVDKLELLVIIRFSTGVQQPHYQGTQSAQYIKWLVDTVVPVQEHPVHWALGHLLGNTHIVQE